MKSLILCFLLLSSWSFAKSQGIAESETIYGHWKGLVIEAGRTGWYPVELKIGEGRMEAPTGYSFYDEYKCGGQLILKSLGSRALGAEYLEQISIGKLRCVNDGRVRVWREGDYLQFEWSHPDYPQVARGRLSRVEDTPSN